MTNTTTTLPSVHQGIQVMLGTDRLPEVTAEQYGGTADLTFRVRHGGHPSAELAVSFTTGKGNAAHLELLLLTALAKVRQLTDRPDPLAAEVARLELGDRAAVGSPLPEPISA